MEGPLFSTGTVQRFSSSVLALQGNWTFVPSFFYRLQLIFLTKKGLSKADIQLNKKTTRFLAANI